MISLLKFIAGYFYVTLTGTNIERIFNVCSRKHILIWNISGDKGEYRCCISKKALPLVKEIIEKTDVSLTINKKIGLPFLLYRHRKRRIFALCVVAACIGLYVMSLFLWDISIKGCESYSKEEIMQFVTSNYAHGGQRLSKIDTLELEDELRSNFKKFAWVSCELKGTQLIIHIKETINLNLKNHSDQPCDLISNREGTIVSIITRSGTPMVKKGDTVKEGDVLVSGTISYQNDAQEVYAYDYVASDADIIIETYMDYEDCFPLKYYKKKYTDNKKAGYKLHFFGNDYNIYSPEVMNDKMDVTEKKYHFKLGKTFYFPIYLTKITHNYYDLQTNTMSKSQAKQAENERFRSYCEKLTKKGVEIVENNVKISIDDDNLTASGKIKVHEAVGKISLIDTTKKETINGSSGENN